MKQSKMNKSSENNKDNEYLVKAKKIMSDINEFAKEDNFRATFSFYKDNLTSSSDLETNPKHFYDLAKIMYAGDQLFDISLPHEIFDDMKDSKEIRKWKHEAFTLSFYFFITYLWRNKTHGHVGDYPLLYQMMLKYYVSGHESYIYDFICKKGGLLEKIGYTQVVNDIPMEYVYYKKNLVQIKMLQDLIKEGFRLDAVPKKLIVHKPLKGYHKYPKVKSDNSDNELDGHLFNLHQTFKIQSEIFLAIVTNQKLGIGGFYFYGFLRKMNELNPHGYWMKKEFIKSYLGLGERTIQDYTSRLKKMNLIEVKQTYKQPNTYIAKARTKKIVIL